jgi:hypothetical protein
MRERVHILYSRRSLAGRVVGPADQEARSLSAAGRQPLEYFLGKNCYAYAAQRASQQLQTEQVLQSTVLLYTSY